MRVNWRLRLLAKLRKKARAAGALPKRKRAPAPRPAPPRAPLKIPEDAMQLFELLLTEAELREWKSREKGRVTVKGTQGHSYEIGLTVCTTPLVKQRGQNGTGVMGLNLYEGHNTHYRILSPIDHVIGQLLMFRHDDKALRRIACGRGFKRP